MQQYPTPAFLYHNSDFQQSTGASFRFKSFDGQATAQATANQQPHRDSVAKSLLATT